MVSGDYNRFRTQTQLEPANIRPSSPARQRQSVEGRGATTSKRSAMLQKGTATGNVKPSGTRLQAASKNTLSKLPFIAMGLVKFAAWPILLGVGFLVGAFGLKDYAFAKKNSDAKRIAKDQAMDGLKMMGGPITEYLDYAAHKEKQSNDSGGAFDWDFNLD